MAQDETDFSIPLGYRFSGVHCGVRANRTKRDLALLVSMRNAAAAGVFTTNRVRAAPVRLDQRRVPASNIRGIVVNSGNANACTGRQGMEDALRMTSELASRLGCTPEQVLVSSTGVIGRPLPMDKIVAGIGDAYGQLGSDAESIRGAAAAILTTDTGTKIASRRCQVGGGEVAVLGLAKGAAMIGPNMATMLAFLLTDASVEPAVLGRILRSAVDASFHCISVEGHTSTNDSVVLLANGASGLGAGSEESFSQAVREVCRELAQAIVRDAEGAGHFITIDVVGTRDDAQARAVAKAVADSVLVKTGICGADPNWGRITSAAGYSGVEFSDEDLSLRMNGTLLFDRGNPVPFDEALESAKLRQNRQVHIELTFPFGTGRCRFWTSDLTTEYVRLNADYTT